MKILDTIFFPETSFHRQLFVIFSVGVTILAIVASTTTAWVTSRQVRTLLVNDGIQVTGALAEQSVLALLYDSGENAIDAARTTLSFPAIEHVTIFNLDRKAILDQGNTGTSAPVPDVEQWIKDKSQLVRDLPGSWHFMAPVYSHAGMDADEDLVFSDTEHESELLGHVYVIMQKDTLRDIQASTFINNISIALFIAAILMLISHASISRLTKPLHKLSRLMGRAQKGETEVYAETQGPKEVVKIASAFNTMMQSLAERDRRLREHNLRLESEVSLRTRELVHARDAALEASRHKSEFLANISHELRTPLQSIIGYSDVLTESMEESGDDEYIGDLERILHNAQHLLTLINGILELAKIEAGRTDLDLEPVDLRSLLRQAEEIINPLMKIGGNRFDVRLEECGNELMLDGGKLLQIILNLLSNSAKFTQDGEVSVEARHSPQELSLSVSDTGIGISEDQQSGIFDPFRQVDGSSTRDFEGTGLGLAITRRFCRLMGGDISVSSRTGHGSTFTVLIPLPVKADFRESEKPEPAPRPVAVDLSTETTKTGSDVL